MDLFELSGFEGRKRKAQLTAHSKSTEGNRDRYLDASKDISTPAVNGFGPSIIDLQGSAENQGDPKGMTAFENLQSLWTDLDKKGSKATPEEKEILNLLSDFMAKRAGT